MSAARDLFQMFIACFKAYQLTKANAGTGYAAITSHGIPRIAVFVAVGREAWRVSTFAVEVKQFKDVP